LLGGLFAQLADEINKLNWVVALNSLLELLSEISNTVGKKIKKFIDCQLRNWFAGLPNYIKLFLPDLIWSSRQVASQRLPLTDPYEPN
jgi:hypothetical protein